MLENPHSIVRAIGVSNFEINHLQDIFELGTVKPAVNQVEFHPYWHEDVLLNFSIANNITFNGYSPLGAPDYVTKEQIWPQTLENDPVIQSITSKYERSAAQILLNWSLQHNILINPRSSNPDHMQDNLKAFEFELDPNDIAQLNNLSFNGKVCSDPLNIS